MTPERADERDPQGAGRPAVERRHRHLRQGQQRDPRRRRRPRQQRAARQRPRAALQGGGRGRQPRHDPAAAASRRRSTACCSTPTSSTTPPAWTPPTTRSTSRSCSTAQVQAKKLTLPSSATSCWPAMTDEVGELVLNDNYRQNQAISLMERMSVPRLGSKQHFIRTLEVAGPARPRRSSSCPATPSSPSARRAARA